MSVHGQDLMYSDAFAACLGFAWGTVSMRVQVCIHLVLQVVARWPLVLVKHLAASFAQDLVVRGSSLLLDIALGDLALDCNHPNHLQSVATNSTLLPGALSEPAAAVPLVRPRKTRGAPRGGLGPSLARPSCRGWGSPRAFLRAGEIHDLDWLNLPISAT